MTETSTRSLPDSDAATLAAADAFTQRAHWFDYRHRHEMFVQQILWEIDQRPAPVTVLDIGCGHGIAGRAAPQQMIADRADVMWGLEPDPTVELQSYFSRTWRSLLEAADVPDASVDIAYSFMVLEHVEDPVAFLTTIARILKPGGVFVGATINGCSYLARISRLCGALRVQDAVLKLARGAEKVEAYHYPAWYRMNTRKRLEQIVAQPGIGLVGLDVTLLERGETEPYFPRPLRWVGLLLTRSLKNRPQSYTNLLLRLRKAT